MKKSIILITLILVCLLIWVLIPRVYPVNSSEHSNLSKAKSWSGDSINAIIKLIDQSENVDAFMVLNRDSIVLEYGDTKELIQLHSARKAIMSLIIGIAIDKGYLHLDDDLQKLGIDNKTIPLTETEKMATIRDLLMSRSGIYLSADAETEWMKENKPSRGQYLSGEHYFYNNFDFNVLNTILIKKTGMNFGECLDHWLARPVELQDYSPDHIIYGNPLGWKNEEHPAYRTWMSTRDLAKIGSMILNKGIWNGTQIISKRWLVESTAPYYAFNDPSNWPLDHMSFCWSVDSKNKTFWATGYGGQYMMIDTTHQLVLVQRNNTGNSLLSQALYLWKSKQGLKKDLMSVWYTLLRNKNKN